MGPRIDVIGEQDAVVHLRAEQRAPHDELVRQQGERLWALAERRGGQPGIPDQHAVHFDGVVVLLGGGQPGGAEQRSGQKHASEHGLDGASHIRSSIVEGAAVACSWRHNPCSRIQAVASRRL
jgi:hypothetical protein